MSIKVHISGVHSGPNPSPGVGVALCLREAFADAELIAVDYSIRSTGLHHPVFNSVFLQRPWPELDLELYQETIQGLSRDAYWLPGLDLEVVWLSEFREAVTNVLAPSAAALKWAVKTNLAVASLVEMSVPRHMHLRESDWELHGFLRRHGWRAWLKGANYEAVQVPSWASFRQLRRSLDATWPGGLFVQEHIPGNEESIAFAAWEGELLGAVHMQKRGVTAEGKTWAGRVEDLDDALLARLTDACRVMGWSGGGELEFVHTPSGEEYMIDFNPRFPAWIYGAALAGRNLPARLVAMVSGQRPSPEVARSPEFARVVTEIPTRLGFPLMPPEPHDEHRSASGKHPSGMPLLARRMFRDSPTGRGETPLDPAVTAELARLVGDDEETPKRLRLPEYSRLWFERAASLVQQANRDAATPIQLAYSLKTDPHPMLLSLAREQGFLAEAISQDEVRLAKRHGFDSSKIVLNGPVPRWRLRPAEATQPLLALFADSTAILKEVGEGGLPAARYVGPRLRPPHLESRFGVDISSIDAWDDLVTLIRRLDRDQSIGTHFHIQSSVVGTQHWRAISEATVGWARELQHATGRAVRCVDLGGGWFPDDADTSLAEMLSSFTASAADVLPDLELVLIEPGKWLAQPTAVVLTRAIELRSDGDAVDLIVDASIADVPDAPLYPHRVVARTPHGSWVPLRSGGSRIYGRLCMEHDILADGVHIPDWMRPGNLLGIYDAGAYDASMAYSFGQGVSLDGEHHD